MVALCPGVTVPGFIDREIVGLITGFGGSNVIPGALFPQPEKSTMAAERNTETNRRHAKLDLILMALHKKLNGVNLC
jgi:hypothetical protein